MEPLRTRILSGNVAEYGVVVPVREMGTVYEQALIVAPPWSFVNMFNKSSNDIVW